ncbi:GRIP and coiled-coil domain-containing protein 1-like [Dreissena polymorpha]|nr:GRIP and coiled-coil domain-containing protein 1-like [Dreissena polymorpha]
MDLERASRGELLRTIEQQKELLDKREQKLRDLIGAYKGVVKEKEALEASVKVLSQGQKSRDQQEVRKGPASDSQGSDRESEEGARPGSDPLNVSKAEDDAGGDFPSQGRLSELQSQVETLSGSLLTLTTQKSKLEASYIADKKSLKQENEELQKKCETLSQKIDSLQKDLASQTQEWRGRVRGQQLEREKEQTDHALMLRELQKLLGQERALREELETKNEELSFSLREQEQVVRDVLSRQDTETAQLRQDLAEARTMLKSERTKSLQPSPQLINLQKEAEELKAQHSILLQEDRARVSESELKARAFGEQCEARIAELESRISELSETVGNYERQRYQDQQNIQRYKDRVSQLEQDNSALCERSRSYGEDEGGNMAEIIERLQRVKLQLKNANTQADHPVNIEELLLDGVCSEHPQVVKYRDELEQVREEFERYRLRAQSVLKNKKEHSPNQEEVLRDHVTELREKIRGLHVQHEDELAHYRQREESLRKSLLNLQDKHKQEALQQTAEHQSQLQELEEEMRRQRDRTVSLLAEKEREIELLRATSTQHIQAVYRSNLEMGGASSERQTSEDEAVTRLLSMPPGGQGETTLLYFAQEQARKDVEISALRKQKREIEITLRDLQVSSSGKQEALYEEIDSLKEEIRKLGRSISREGANLEYLKNVTYKFLICHDPVGKQQMLNAITTILQFSPQEKSSVQSLNKHWWSATS